ncbi:MAG: undecaprenyldiphospho-muramoylpentapeptide beta-N-acetylglucosaminyltransferase [Alphaproteobacteria bacterium]|nr:undecaprenyldiphospho-muramoylpentapeptide beta-N-acetylglucosaminyltransferase [Alphaproteobacteria bacterium]MDE2341465.1 undecaprenyldiphospho-muramoylpentapeptide beta-N-acetylglucosaminyltransferase [Alphaproteobacteria bacterium]
MSITRHFILAAGGTGGHMMPASALADELVARGHSVALITDARGAKIPGLCADMDVHVIPAGRITKNPMSWPGGARAILSGRRQSRALYQDFAPCVVVGFGGYPAYPALMAAHSLGIPTAVHEQNAVLGRVNRQVAGSVAAIATAYPDIQRLPDHARTKVHQVGNPVRAEVLALRDLPFPALDGEGIFRVLVTGGSQGANILSDVVPEGLSMLPPHFRSRLQVTQQCRAEDIDRVRAAYIGLGIPSDLATYIPDMPEKLSWAHLVIARAGASTIAELTCAGRPAILIPLPSAMDNHQTHNVREMVAAGGARAIHQADFTPVELAKQMQKLGLEPAALANAAARARSVGRPHATRDLADLVESLGRTPVMDGIEVRKPVRARTTGAFAGARA